MNDTEHAALVGELAVILQRVKYVPLGASLEPLAEEIIAIVTAARDAEIREALLSDGAIHDLAVGTHGCGNCVHYPDKDSQCWTSCVRHNTRGMKAALKHIGLGDGAGGQGDVGITLRSSEERAKLRREALDMFGDYEYESEWDTQR